MAEPRTAWAGNGGWMAAAAAAVAAPALIAFNVPPSATFLNQAASLIGWGGWLLLIAAALPGRAAAGRRDSGASALLAALVLLAAAALVSPLWTKLPSTLSLSAAGLLAAAVLTAAAAVAVQRAGLGVEAFAAFCFALLAAGIASALIGLVQVYASDLTDGNWIAVSSLGDRAVGNLRQPNHLCSLLLWAMIATLWLAESGRLPRRLAPALLLLLFTGVVLSASRTGMLGAALLALWGIVDRRLARSTRVQLWLAPLAYALIYAAITFYAHQHNEVFGGEAQLQKSDISSSRFGIWANTLSLIAAHPWLGVGFGEFNFAWSLNAFPGRPTAFFDHTHNLPLHLAVELGLPLATIVIALLLWALWRAWATAREGDGDDLTMRRAALVMVLMISLHSLLEYPLWYAYFLLPAVFAFGLCLGGTTAAQPAPAPASPTAPRLRPLAVAALLLMAGSVASVWDYWRVVVIGGCVAAVAAYRAGPAQLVLRPPCRLCRGHHRAAPVAGDAGLRACAALPAGHAHHDRLGHRAGRDRPDRPRAPPRAAPARVPQPAGRRLVRGLRQAGVGGRRATLPVRAAGQALRLHRLPLREPQGAATQSPDLPPCFSSTRTPSMTMPRSAALHMS
jgi:O-antigen ligase